MDRELEINVPNTQNISPLGVTGVYFAFPEPFVAIVN
jgi:hypothetical protein